MRRRSARRNAASSLISRASSLRIFACRVSTSSGNTHCHPDCRAAIGPDLMTYLAISWAVAGTHGQTHERFGLLRTVSKLLKFFKLFQEVLNLLTEN